MIRINNVKVPLDMVDYRQVISQQLNISKNKIKDVKLVKQAVDARRKNKIHLKKKIASNHKLKYFVKY